MSKAEAYKIDSFSTSFNREVKRLRAQVDLFWEKELAYYSKVGLQDGMEVLECGCGPGFLIDKLSWTYPNCHFTGIEIEPKLLEVFNSRIETECFKNVVCCQGSIMQIGFPEESFDFVISRLVLEHLSNPLGAIKEMGRVLKPGGKVVFVSNDFDYHLRTFPHIPELSDLYDAYCRARIAQGGNPRIGRQMPDLLYQAGFSDIQLELLGAHSQSSGDALFLQSEGVGISAQLVKDGFLERSTLDVIAAKWKAMLNAKSHAIFRQLFVASGVKGNGFVDGSESVFAEAITSPKLGGATRETAVQAPVLQIANCSVELLQERLVEWVAIAIDVDPVEISHHVPLEEYGFDSLGAMEVQKCLLDEYGAHVEIVIFFEKQTIAAVAEHVISLVNDLRCF